MIRFDRCQVCHQVMLAIISFLACLAIPVQAEKFDATKFEKEVLSVVEKARPAVVAIADRGSTFSGVVVESNGLILSAGHAVRPGRSYTVIFEDGRRVRARGLGVNEVVDCAMLKIMGDGPWPYVEMGDSSTLVKNQPCVSISHPGRFDGDRGAVVRLGFVVDPLTYRGMIQSTAKMEPGDSGGPLLDLQGRVIGIHSNIRTSVDRNYEVPVNAFKKYREQLLVAKRFEANNWPSLPKLGLQVQENDTGDGLEVTRVDAGQPAALAGLREADEILIVAGRRVVQNDVLGKVLRDLAISNRRQFEVKIRRGKRNKSLTFDLVQGRPMPRRVPELSRLPREIATLEAKLDDNVVQVRSEVNGKQRDVWATRIKPLPGGGNLISKGSLVGPEPKIQLSNGRIVAAKVIRRDDANDLVLLAAPVGAGGIDLNRSAGDPQALPGKFLVTPDPKGEGYVSVWGSKYFNVPRTRSSGGFLGAYIEQRGEQVLLRQVERKLAADSAGLAAGDRVLKLNDRNVRNSDDVFNFLKQADPFESVRVLISRDGQELEKQVVLGRRPDMTRHVANQLPGGKSLRRDGFQLAMTHDANVRPEQCGGPVFDLRGEFLGINLARNSRTRTYVVPKSVLQQFAAK